MIKIGKIDNIDYLEALKKWSPIIEKYTSNLSYMKDKFSVMCEILSLVPIQEHISLISSLMPKPFIAESLNLASKLDLKDKNVQITYSPTFLYFDELVWQNGMVESYQVRVKLDSDVPNQDDLYENLLIGEAVKLINSKLENYKSIVIYRLIESISDIEDVDGRYKILRFRVGFFDEIEVKA
jgi:hypothetical protein